MPRLSLLFALLTTLASAQTASPAVEIKINFQPDGYASSTPAGYLADEGRSFATRGNGYSYGWSTDNSTATRRRSTPAELLLESIQLTTPPRHRPTLQHCPLLLLPNSSPPPAPFTQ
jgi:hypothetical protein